MNDNAHTRPTLDRTLSVAVFVFALAAFLWATTRRWNDVHFVGHESGQVLNAIGSDYMARNPGSPGLLYETPSLVAPWGVHTEFPLYQASVAATARLTGWGIAPSGRAVSLASFLLAVPALFLILGRLGLVWHRRLVVLAVVVLTPVYLFYSRAVLAEGTAFALAAWFLASYIRFAGRHGSGWGVAASLLGAGAAVVKFTTLAAFLVPALFIAFASLAKPPAGVRPGFTARLRELSRLVIPLLSAMAAAGAWTAHSAALRRLHPSAELLIPDQLAASGLGTLAQRFGSEFWLRIGEHTVSTALPLFGVALTGILAFTGDGRQRRAIGACVLCFVAGPLVFASRYLAHDHYFYAGAAFLAAALGLGLVHVLDERRIHLVARWTLVAAALAGQWLGYALTYRPLLIRGEPDSQMLSRMVEQATDGDEVSVIIGDSWDLSIPYYARRRAITIQPMRERDASGLTRALENLKPAGPVLMIAPGNLRLLDDFVPPLALRLGMEPRPALQVDRTSVFFMRQDRVPNFMTRLRGTGLFKAVAMLEDPKMFSMMSPMPYRVEAEYGLELFDHGHGPSLSAHAPTDLYFEIPENASRVTIEFGMLPGAYTGRGDSDGVEFAIVLRRSNGADTVLFSKFLNPVLNESDRLEKRGEAQLPPDAQGQVLVRTLPGPDKRNNFDWGYWKLVEIR